MVPESPQKESPLLCAWRQRSGVSPFIQRLATVLFPKPGFHISKMVSGYSSGSFSISGSGLPLREWQKKAPHKD
jgi:hypothetical protein